MADHQSFHPVNWHSVAPINKRTHRMLLAIDGRVGFSGGVGIADSGSGDGDASDHWGDSHNLLEGPAVSQMQVVFCENWIRTRGKVLVGSAYFPEVTVVGDSSAQMFKSSPDGDSENVQLMYLLSITSATKNIRLQAAYFVPDELPIRTIVAARKRGVKVGIIVPEPNTDSELVADRVPCGLDCLMPELKFRNTSPQYTIAGSSSLTTCGFPSARRISTIALCIGMTRPTSMCLMPN